VRMRHLTIAMMAGFLVFGVAAAQETKIGVFDFGRVTQETAEGQRIQKQLQDFQAKKQAELASKEKELKDLQDKLMAQALALAPERKAAMEKEIQKKQNELQVAREGAQREWQIEFNEAQEGFLEKVRKVVEALGREENYTVILERDQTVYFGEAHDVSKKIVERFDKMTPPVPPAQAAPAAPPK